MDLSELQSVYRNEGPFVTVYLEGRSPGEDAAKQTRLRWQALRERLESEGAAAEAVEAVESAVADSTAGEEQANGRVLVADSSGLVLDRPWDAALGAGDNAHWTVLPELGAHVRESTGAVREVVVIADQTGAQVRTEIVTEQHEPYSVDSSEVQGSSTDSPHKPRGGALSHNQIQRRADEAVQRNAKEIAEHVHTVVAKVRPQVVVLAGDVQARTAVREQLTGEARDQHVETDRGVGDDQASEEALMDELLRIAAGISERRMRGHADRFHEASAHGLGVQGAEEVAKAAEMGAVEILLFESGVPATREAFLLKACADTSSAVGMLEQGTGVDDGVAAVLRFPVSG